MEVVVLWCSEFTIMNLTGGFNPHKILRLIIQFPYGKTLRNTFKEDAVNLKPAENSRSKGQFY